MCEINDLIKLCEDDSRLLAAIQELGYYRNNPLANMKPCAKYVRKNGMFEQLKHIKSEVKEYSQTNSLKEMALEWWDVGQSWLTGMEILRVKYGVDIDKLVKEGQKKNNIRGYNE